MPETQRATGEKKSTKKRKGAVLGFVVVVIAIAVAGFGALAYQNLTSARDDLGRATTDASELQDALQAGDQALARTELAQLQRNVHSAESTLSSRVLSIAAGTPLIGKNVKAVRTVTSAVATVADDGLPPLVDVADTFNAKTFNPRGGRIDVAAVDKLAPSLTASSEAIARAEAEIGRVDASSLLDQLREPVTDAQSKIREAGEIATRAATASRVVPQLLQGKRTYLLMFQNNAEIRATGGLPGAYAQLDVDNGSIKLGGQGTGGSLSELRDPASPLTDEEEVLFTDLLVTDFRDVNFTPDFPRAAEIASAILKNEKGVDVDGVLSIDPVTLAYLLRSTGPIDLEDGTRLTADNAIDILLNGVYVTYPVNAYQDAFFASAAQKVFDKVLAGSADPTTLLKALTAATNERRVSLWSKDADVTKAIAGTPLAHELPTGDAASPALGFYLNDATGAKMQYYLDYSVAGTAAKCTDKGVQSYTSEMTLRSTAPADAASLPESIQGPGFGAEPGSMLMNLYLYGTHGGTINNVEIDNEEMTFTRATHEGRPVVILTIQVDPGQTVTVQSTLTSGPGQTGPTRVTSTPSIKPGAAVQTWKSAC